MESDMTVTDATLFEIVRQGRMAMTAVVDDWIEAYKVTVWMCFSLLLHCHCKHFYNY